MPTSEGEIDLAEWATGPDRAIERRTAFIFAHPDDETVTAAALLWRTRDALLVHVTDGAPLDRRWWGVPTLSSREAYSRLRRRELDAALDAGGVRLAEYRCLGHVDQSLCRQLVETTNEMVALLRAARPRTVFTHAYEGGHPDHDATAFAVHAARRVLDEAGESAPTVIECAGYFARGRELVRGELLPGATPVVERRLGPAEWARKKAMLDRFRSQRRTLDFVTGNVEHYRAARAPDFTTPPHQGPLYYERYEWGATGEEWRSRARAALRQLGLGELARC